MILNRPLVLAEDLSSATSSKIFDGKKAGDAEKQLWVRISCASTAVTAGSFALVTGDAIASDASSITSAKTLISASASASAKVGDVILQARLPLGVLRYLQVVSTDANGKYNAEIVLDVETSLEAVDTFAVVG